MTDVTPPPLSPEELDELESLCERGLTTLADATLILISVPRLIAEAKAHRPERTQ